MRPSVLFATAFVLVTTPHEAAHAVTAYLLGFNLTLFKMWVNPDASSATPMQTFAIAVAGPIFSLVLGAAAWLIYKFRFKRRDAGLLLLMLTIAGIYSFLGPTAATALGRLECGLPRHKSAAIRGILSLYGRSSPSSSVYVLHGH
jgi:hypothetical protein